MRATICEVCNKQFIKPVANTYKTHYKSKTKHFCSYKCWNYVLKLREDQKFEELDKLFEHSDKMMTL